MSCQKLGFLDFGGSLLVFSTNLNLLYLLYLMVLRYYPLHLRRQNCFLKAFLRTLILITLVFLSLPASCSRANLKQHNILVSRKLVQKVMTYFDSFKSSGPDCIPVMDLKNWTWTFIHISWILKYMFKGILFSRLLESLICEKCLYLTMLVRDLPLNTTTL